MKRLILVLLFMACLTFQASAELTVTVLGGSSVSCDISNIIFWWRCEAADFTATNGTLDYSAASPVGALEGGAAINADAHKYGTNGLDLSSFYDHIYFTTPSATLDDEGKWGAWVRLTSFTDDRILFYVYGDANNYFKLRLDGTDELNISWKDSSTDRTELVSTDANLALNTWYWIEIAWKTSTNYREIFVNGVSKGSSSADIASFGVAVARIYIGDTTGLAQDTHIDNVIIGTDSTDDFHTICKDELEWPG